MYNIIGRTQISAVQLLQVSWLSTDNAEVYGKKYKVGFNVITVTRCFGWNNNGLAVYIMAKNGRRRNDRLV